VFWIVVLSNKLDLNQETRFTINEMAGARKCFGGRSKKFYIFSKRGFYAFKYLAGEQKKANAKLYEVHQI
jgi:hypothetical protein